jgi:hypothetical protein
MDYDSFKFLLLEKNIHEIIIRAFEKLNITRRLLTVEGYPTALQDMIWEASTEILWHVQSEVVQPLFDKLSELFSRAMTFFASFDSKINHHKIRTNTRSRFILFMLFNNFSLVKKSGMIPDITHLAQRWYWIFNALLKKWRIVESDSNLITEEIQLLSQPENRNLKFRYLTFILNLKKN